MLYNKKPKTVEEIESDLVKFTQRDKRWIKFFLIVLILSVPLSILTLTLPELVSQVIPVSFAVPITASLVSMSLGFLIIFKWMIPQNAQFHYELLKPAKQKDIELCDSLLSQERMKLWRNYVSKARNSGRELYNYETNEIQQYWKEH